MSLFAQIQDEEKPFASVEGQMRNGAKLHCCIIIKRDNETGLCEESTESVE